MGYRGPGNVPGPAKPGNLQAAAATGTGTLREQGPAHAMTVDPNAVLPGRAPGACVDTRSPGGPPGRTYSVAFARVWDVLVEEIGSRRGWTLVHADEELGLLTATCRPVLPRGLDDLTVWVRLDDNGLTRVDMRSAPRSGRRDFGSNSRRVRELADRLDQVLGGAARVRAGG